MLRAAVLIIVACLALTACDDGDGGDDGDGDSPSTAVGTTLDEACTKVAVALVDLPRRQRDENLSLDEVQTVADETTDDLVDTIEATDVPPDLETTKRDLLDLTSEDPPEDREGFKDHISRQGALYHSLGADRCRDYGEASVKVLDGASVSDAYRGLPLPGIDLD